MPADMGIKTMYKTQLQTALELGVSQHTMQLWVKEGCPHILLNPKATGRSVRRRFDVQAVKAWVEQRAAGKGVEA